MAFKSADPNGNAWYATQCTEVGKMPQHTLKANTCLTTMPIPANTVQALFEHKMPTTCILVQYIKKSTKWPKSGDNRNDTTSSSMIADYHTQRQEYISRGLEKCGSEWKCLICNTMYRHRHNVVTHIEVKHLQDEHAYSCQFCSRTFKSLNAFRVHTSTVHQSEAKMAKIFGRH